ncbi:MAG: flagellar filament capping protein FliD [Candidatus Fibromonas sp.]|jgi:flagellar hook-associated protein 2|nr:flagellar filament capping protein FliD [Candidatus Fibromonas sp.]
MAGMSVGGLVSGLDTNSIVAQLTALEQAKVTREMKKKDDAQKTLDKFKDLQTRLGNLSAKAASLETPDKFNVFKALSNYEDYAVISGREGATAGSYDLVVNQLASTQKVASNKIDAVNTPVVDAAAMSDVFGANDTIKITLSRSEAAIKADSTKKTVDISISKTDTLKDIVNKINAAEGTGVKASIMTLGDGDNRLVLTAVDTGTKGFSMTQDNTGTSVSLMEYLGVLSVSTGDQVAASSGALLTNNGTVADKDTTFDELNMALNKLKPSDAIGIYLPTENGDGSGNDGWVTFSLYKSGSYRTIDEVLEEINGALETSGSGIRAELNASGEIVLRGDLDGDQNFSQMGGVKIQIGTLKNGVAGDSFSGDASIFSDVKKDMGTLSKRNEFANVISEGKNAIYSIDGMWINSQSNSDDKTISGSVFTLKKVSQPGMEHIKVSLEIDMDGLASKISEFIEEYNSLMKFIDENTKATVKEDTDKTTGKKTTVRETGAFTGDTGVSSLRDNLRQMLTGVIDQITEALGKGYNTKYSSAATIGITTQKDGSMSVDKDKLLKALNSDLEGVRKLFTTGSFSDNPEFKVGYYNKSSTTGVYQIDAATGEVRLNGELLESSVLLNIITLKNGLSFEVPTSGTANVTFVRGIAGQIANFVEKAKSSVDGYFKQSEKTYQTRIDSIQKRIDELQMRVDNYTARITRQFSTLERSMANLQSQTANMMAALNSTSYR